MPLTQQSPIQKQGSQPMMSRRGVVGKEYSDNELNFNQVPYSEQTLGYSTKLSPDQISSVNKYSDKQISIPEQSSENSFSSINDSYNKMFSDYQSYSFDPMKRAPTKERRPVSMGLRDPNKSAGFYDDPKNYASVTLDAVAPQRNEFSDKYSDVKSVDLPSFEKNKSYKQDLLKNPALSMFDERASFVNKFNTLWKPLEKSK